MNDLITELDATARRLAAEGHTDEPAMLALAAKEIERLKSEAERFRNYSVILGHVSALLENEQMVDGMTPAKAVEQVICERDQLTAHCENLSMAASMAVGALPNKSCIADVCVAAVRHFNGTGGQSVEQSMARHDAEVIDREIEWLHTNYPHLDGPHLGLLHSRANQLRQPVKEVQPSKESCELECGAYGAYCRCNDESKSQEA
ncbi:hypothetical protein [Marinobacterium sp. BA1]|uniref:hypothetical protein n=1 Tax=Marinobacterium sp. BA1 TaxID=3138931 RepID=UPI0032E55585